MYAALAEGGEIDGVRLFSRRTLGLATELQQEAPGRAVLPFDMRWRLGYHGIATSEGFAPQAFGHFGFGGSGAWADPSRRLAVGMIVNCGMGTPSGMEARVSSMRSVVAAVRISAAISRSHACAAPWLAFLPPRELALRRTEVSARYTPLRDSPSSVHGP